MSNSFTWCGYNWKVEMDGGRIIHPGQPWMWYDSENIMLEKNNILNLTIENKPKQIQYWDGSIFKPTIACGTMRSIESFDYGTFSAEIMCPKGYNLWPSFWLSGSGNWPPEIDIMEAWSENNSYYRWCIPQPPYLSPSWKTTTNVHYNDNNMNKTSIGSRNVSFFKSTLDPAENFIKYELVWKPNEIIFKVNGKNIRTADKNVARKLTENIKDKTKGYKMNVIFNLWCENPKEYNVKLLSPMKIKNFSYHEI
jgi:beta-glucanase (GH16 family)